MAVSDILHGPVAVWHAPVGETPPADSVAAGAVWGGNWAKFGFTKTPLSANYEFDELEIEVQEALTAIDRRKTRENFTLETTLAEMTAANLGLGSSGTVTTTAAGASQVGKEELEVGGDDALDQYAWGFEGTYIDDDGDEFPLRLFIWKGTAKTNGTLEFGREDYPGIPLQVKALADTSKDKGKQLYKFQRVTGAATS